MILRTEKANIIYNTLIDNPPDHIYPAFIWCELAVFVNVKAKKVITIHGHEDGCLSDIEPFIYAADLIFPINEYTDTDMLIDKLINSNIGEEVVRDLYNKSVLSMHDVIKILYSANTVRIYKRALDSFLSINSLTSLEQATVYHLYEWVEARMRRKTISQELYALAKLFQIAGREDLAEEALALAKMSRSEIRSLLYP